MNTLFLYSSKYGATKDCAQRIADRLQGAKDLINLDIDGRDVSLSTYDTVVLGCSVYMGKPRKAAIRFARQQKDALLQKRLGLYLCCIQDIEKNVLQQLELAYPAALRKHAAAMEQLGGVVDFTKLRKVDGVVMNMIAGDLRKKTNSDLISTVSDERIAGFVKQLLEAPDNA